MILNKADVPPFPLDSKVANEDLRLSYRYLDLRRSEMIHNLRTRHRVAKAARDYLDERGYLEIETPVLSNPTPEGARDFLVPSRLTPGSFYALPQAPQQYKQLLQVGGIEKYFQIARCFRDEDLRADRQPEFTQIDIEASFITEEEIQTLVEGMLARIFRESRGVEIPLALPAHDASRGDGALRFGQARHALRRGADRSRRHFPRGAIQGFPLGGRWRRRHQGHQRQGRGHAPEQGAAQEMGGMGEDGTRRERARLHQVEQRWRMGIADREILQRERRRRRWPQRMNFEEGDVLFFGADKWEAACETLGRVRLRVAELLKLTEGRDDLNFLWVVDFPLLQFSAEDNRWAAVHHPFTRPKAEDLPLLDAKDYGKVRAVAYDVVLNGVELGGGSIRIHERELQARMFEVLGVSAEEQEHKFGHLLRAFSFGAPPHGGIALGLDRLVMLICRAESIREVIAFPEKQPRRGFDDPLARGGGFQAAPRDLHPEHSQEGGAAAP